MNKRIQKKRRKILVSKFQKLDDQFPTEAIKTDSKGRITNFDELSKDTQDWILHG